jgi:hypothetical protein
VSTNKNSFFFDVLKILGLSLIPHFSVNTRSTKLALYVTAYQGTNQTKVCTPQAAHSESPKYEL